MAKKIDYPKTEIAIKNEKMRNFADRINFIKYWVNYLQTHSDEDWSEGQAVLINGQFEATRHFYSELQGSNEGKLILERLRKERLKVNTN